MRIVLGLLLIHLILMFISIFRLVCVVNNEEKYDAKAYYEFIVDIKIYIAVSFTPLINLIAIWASFDIEPSEKHEFETKNDYKDIVESLKFKKNKKKDGL